MSLKTHIGTGFLMCVAVTILGCTMPGPSVAGLKTIRDCADCPEMIVMPPGSFLAGSPPGETDREKEAPVRAAREHPQIRVTFAKPFAIGKYQVTRGEYGQFVRETHRDVPGGCSVLLDYDAHKYGVDPRYSWQNPGFAQTDKHPVVCVSLADAMDYAAWLSKKTGHVYRLPSGSEWEYAARGGTTTARWWGDGREGTCVNANGSDLDRAAFYKVKNAGPDDFFQCHDGYAFTAPVGSFKPNPFGLYDALGNVHAWTTDCVHDTQEGLPTDGSAWTTGNCKSHYDRGGGWTNYPHQVRVAFHHDDLVGIRNQVAGIRVVREID